MKKQKIIFYLVFVFAYLTTKSQNPEAKDTTVLSLKAKLISSITNSPGCGVYAWAVAQKYEVLESNNYLNPKSIIIVLQPCPELLGKNFLKNGNVYSLLLSKENLDPFSYLVVNPFKKKKFPIMWCREIILAE